MGLVNDITATVVAPHGLEADGLDTAASVLGCARGLALIDAHPAAAGLIIEKMNGSVTASTSVGFRKLVRLEHEEAIHSGPPEGGHYGPLAFVLLY
jgi:hypothetical protein